jgi:hypothetical protein
MWKPGSLAERTNCRGGSRSARVHVPVADGYHPPNPPVRRQRQGRRFLDIVSKLLFTATALVPCIAYGASIDTSPPGSIPPVPAGATPAGFTTLALNSDFRQKLASNWLGGCAAAGNGSPVNTNDTTGHTWWMNIWWSYTYQPCNVVQVADPVFGGTVLDIPWTVDINAENVGTVIQSAAWFSTGAPGTALTFPNNAYYEITLRIVPIAPGSWGGMFTWPLLAMTDSSKAGLEYDIIELDTGKLGASDAAVHNFGVSGNPGRFLWSGQRSPGLPSNFDPTQYHKFAVRTTSDGNSLSACAYIDDVFQNCIDAPGGITATEANEREFLIVQNACDYWNYSQPCASGQQQHLYVMSVRVWSCYLWQTTQCNGLVLTGAP